MFLFFRRSEETRLKKIKTPQKTKRQFIQKQR